MYAVLTQTNNQAPYLLSPEQITGILMTTVLSFDVLILNESYSNTLLVFKACRLRHESDNWALHAKHEEWDVNLHELAHKYLFRPSQLVATPICFCMALYASFVYGILYQYVPSTLDTLCHHHTSHSSFAAFPIEFQETRGWNPLVGSIPFAGTLLGCALGSRRPPQHPQLPFYNRKYIGNNSRPRPRSAAPADDDRRVPLSRRPLPLRLDVQQKRLLDLPLHRGDADRGRLSDHLPGVAELPDRYVPAVRRERGGRHDGDEEPAGRRVPAVYVAYVS